MLYTHGKWKKERSQHHPEDREKALEFFVQAASVPRLDDALTQAVAPERLASEQRRYEALVDEALYQASLCAPDVGAAKEYLGRIVQRDATPEVVAKAEGRLEHLGHMAEDSSL